MSALETIFQSFTWLPNVEVNNSDRLLMRSKDVAAGASSILKLLESDQLSRDNDETPILSAFHAGNMLRMAISSLDLIVEATDLYIDRRIEDHEKGESK